MCEKGGFCDKKVAHKMAGWAFDDKFIGLNGRETEIFKKIKTLAEFLWELGSKTAIQCDSDWIKNYFQLISSLVLDISMQRES